MGWGQHLQFLQCFIKIRWSRTLFDPANDATTIVTSEFGPIYCQSSEVTLFWVETKCIASSREEEPDISAIPASGRHDPLAGRYYGGTVKIRRWRYENKTGLFGFMTIKQKSIISLSIQRDFWSKIGLLSSLIFVSNMGDGRVKIGKIYT